MPLFIAAIWGGLISVMGTMVVKVLISLGVAYVTYLGVDTAIMWAKGQFLAGLVGAPAAAVQLMGLMKVGQCISMLTSAYLGRMVLGGMVGGAIKKMVVK